jgi:hypothetical protein
VHDLILKSYSARVASANRVRGHACLIRKSRVGVFGESLAGVRVGCLCHAAGCFAGRAAIRRCDANAPMTAERKKAVIIVVRVIVIGGALRSSGRRQCRRQAEGGSLRSNDLRRSRTSVDCDSCSRRAKCAVPTRTHRSHQADCLSTAAFGESAGDPSIHIHTMYRDPSNDDGRKGTAKSNDSSRSPEQRC